MKTLLTVTNSKLGGYIAQLNFPAGISCRPDAPCAHGCYANKHHFRMVNIVNSMQEKLTFYFKDPDKFFRCLDTELMMIPYNYMRYFSSGDIPDGIFFLMMCRLARRHPFTHFLCFTKKYEIINEYLSEGKRIPSNLVVVLSNWGDWIAENPHSLPTAWVMFGDERDSHIPDDARTCSGNCGNCVLTDSHCWNMKKNDSVKFKKH